MVDLEREEDGVNSREGVGGVAVLVVLEAFGVSVVAEAGLEGVEFEAEGFAFVGVVGVVGEASLAAVDVSVALCVGVVGEGVVGGAMLNTGFVSMGLASDERSGRTTSAVWLSSRISSAPLLSIPSTFFSSLSRPSCWTSRSPPLPAVFTTSFGPSSFRDPSALVST